MYSFYIFNNISNFCFYLLGSALSSAEDRMIVVFEEMQDLKGVWSELSKIWIQIDEIREKPWLSVQPRKLRQQLDGLTNQLKELPARFRQYSSYEYVKKLLQSYVKVSVFIYFFSNIVGISYKLFYYSLKYFTLLLFLILY